MAHHANSLGTGRWFESPIRSYPLNSQPVLLIGMDVLGTLDTLVIDCALQELQLRTRN